ncbi:MAG: single-stranded DNA-binding protein, partial [Oscillospiraceae bacterium]
MLNCAVIMGRLTAEPELRTTNSGLSVTSFTVAVDRAFVKAGEERQADFINVVAWRGTADFVTRYFHKGSM